MFTKERQYKIILDQYDKKRTKAEILLSQRKELIYEEIPRIKELDKELSLTGVRISKLIIHNPNQIKKLTKELMLNNDILLKEKVQLLLNNDYPQNFLEIMYDCPICKDTGYIDTKKCNCLKQNLINIAYSQSNLQNILSVENFNTFNFAYYSESYTNNEELSPRQNMIQIRNYSLKFIETFENNANNLILYGKTGLGKTFLCNSIAKELLDKGFTVLYLTSFALFQIFENHRFSYKSNVSKTQDHFDTIFDVDLLIIDDLGTEFTTSLTGVELFNCINSRILTKKSTIISTNLQPNEWGSQYSERFTSRILGHYKIMKFFGNDIRLQKTLGYN